MIIEDIKQSKPSKGSKLPCLVMIQFTGEYPTDEEVMVALGEKLGHNTTYEIINITTNGEGGKVYLKEVI